MCDKNLTITISGREGSGKTTMMNIISQILVDIGFNVSMCEEREDPKPAESDCIRMSGEDLIQMNKDHHVIVTTDDVLDHWVCESCYSVNALPLDLDETRTCIGCGS